MTTTLDHLTAGGHRLEYRRLPGRRSGAPCLVLLHEGLGSVGLWRDFPEKLAAATGCPVLAYSRYGYGGSDPLRAPRPLHYLQDEALLVLPELLEALAVEAPLLVGHSDGASIALLHAADAPRPTAVIFGQNGVATGAGTLADSVLKAAGFRNLAAERGFSGMAPYPLELLIIDRPDVVHRAICDTLCAVFPTLNRELLLSSGKVNHTTCWMRHVGMYLMSDRLQVSQGATGRMFGRDRTTVTHAVQLCRIEAEARPATKAFFDFLERETLIALDEFVAVEALEGTI